MSQQNVNTAAKESEESSLSTDQVMDLFDWLVSVTNGQRQQSDFEVPAGAEEHTAFDEDGPDYYTVWILNGWPIAAEAPLDGLLRVLAGEGK